MTDTLIVQLIPPISRADEEENGGIDCAAQWLRLSEEATADASKPETGELSRLLQDPPAECHWVILLPGEDVLTTSVKLPGKRRRQALRALPFMLEDSIASDVALEHLAVGPDNAEGRTLVAVTRKQQLRDLLGLFAEAGIAPHAVLPDYAMLPESPDAWQILVSGDRAIVRCPDGTGFSTPLPRLELLLDTGPDPEPDSPARTARITLPADAPAPRLPGDWQIDEQRVAGTLQPFAEGAGEAPLNLLQGEFRVIQRDRWNWRPWATAAMLALAAIALGLLETGLETLRLDRETEQLQAAMVELAREALPDTQPIRDPQTQLLIAWRQLSNGGKGGEEFLPLLNRVSAIISQQPVTVQGVHFKDGELTLALQGSSLQQLDSLRLQIERQGLYASLLNASTDNDSARSNLVIQAERPRAAGSAG